MRVGSIIELARDWNDVALEAMEINDMHVPVKNTYYTIRGIFKGKGIDGESLIGITLEEFENDKNSDGQEFGYDIEHFRELLPPSPLEIGDHITSKI